MQYSDSKKLQIRIDFYRKYAVGDNDWFEWVWKIVQFQIKENGVILEVGSGPGSLWNNRDGLIPRNASVIVSDKSVGMVMESYGHLQYNHNVHCCVMDANKIAIRNSSIDILIADHMIYLINDKESALNEFNRVIKDSGVIYISTNGRSHLNEIFNILRQTNCKFRPKSRDFTTVELNTYLTASLQDIVPFQYAAAFKVFEPQDVYEYITSLECFEQADKNDKKKLKTIIDERFKEFGFISLNQDTVLFQCKKREIHK